MERYQILFPGETSYVLDLKTFTPRTKAPPPITAESVEAAAVGGPDAMCAFCGTDSKERYTLPAVAAVAGIVGLVTWLRKKKAA